MEPCKQSGAKQNCVTNSSNCIIWQGPDIPCINLCKGDSISDVTYKLAMLVCKLQAELDLSALDLSCLVNKCAACPDPDKSLINVLTLIISNICTPNTPAMEPAYVVGGMYDLTDAQIAAIVSNGGSVSYV